MVNFTFYYAHANSLIYKRKIWQTWKQMYSLHSPLLHLHSSHSSLSTKTTHILPEKIEQKPVMTTSSTQLPNIVTEPSILTLYGSKNACIFCQGNKSHDSDAEMLATFLETLRESSSWVLPELSGIKWRASLRNCSFCEDASSFCKWEGSVFFQPPWWLSSSYLSSRAWI